MMITQSTNTSRAAMPVIVAIVGFAVVCGAFLVVMQSRDALVQERGRLADARAALEDARTAASAARDAEATATSALAQQKARWTELSATSSAPMEEAAPASAATLVTDRLLTLATGCLLDADGLAHANDERAQAQVEALLVRMGELLSFQQKRTRTNPLPDLDLAVGRALAKAGLTQRAMEHLARSIDATSESVGPSERLEAAAALVPIALTAGDLMLTTSALKHAREAVAALDALDQMPGTATPRPTILVPRNPADRRLLLAELETEGLRHARQTRTTLDRFESRLSQAEAFGDPARLRAARLAYARFVAQASDRDEELDRAEAAARTALDEDRRRESSTPDERMESHLRLLAVLFTRGRRDQCQPMHAELLRLLGEHPLNERAALQPFGGDLTDYLIASQEWNAAERLLHAAWQACAEPPLAKEITPGERQLVVARYIALCEARGQPKEAETWKATLATLRAAAPAAPASAGSSRYSRFRGGAR